jgi:hypothetical protein
MILSLIVLLYTFYPTRMLLYLFVLSSVLLMVVMILSLIYYFLKYLFCYKNNKKILKIIEIANYKEPICSICYEEYNNELDVVETKCGHQFHKDCLFTWWKIKNSNDCSYCRTKNVDVNIVRIK